MPRASVMPVWSRDRDCDPVAGNGLPMKGETGGLGQSTPKCTVVSCLLFKPRAGLAVCCTWHHTGDKGGPSIPTTSGMARCLNLRACHVLQPPAAQHHTDASRTQCGSTHLRQPPRRHKAALVCWRCVDSVYSYSRLHRQRPEMARARCHTRALPIGHTQNYSIGLPSHTLVLGTRDAIPA
ncbi:hypothetical protein NDU88_005866 [Pleurodeles waltl]|uniref:Uncharacterized protein n=1 Tax=Pleurodeles waltl TaxID=8319 RepID=A0AAV7SN06_PLEWA|nr:hypothetical protein NDU88_005866 [Pleurodeles waltl]